MRQSWPDALGPQSPATALRGFQAVSSQISRPTQTTANHTNANTGTLRPDKCQAVSSLPQDWARPLSQIGANDDIARVEIVLRNRNRRLRFGNQSYAAPEAAHGDSLDSNRIMPLDSSSTTTILVSALCGGGVASIIGGIFGWVPSYCFTGF